MDSVGFLSATPIHYFFAMILLNQVLNEMDVRRRNGGTDNAALPLRRYLQTISICMSQSICIRQRTNVDVTYDMECKPSMHLEHMAGRRRSHLQWRHRMSCVPGRQRLETHNKLSVKWIISSHHSMQEENKKQLSYYKTQMGSYFEKSGLVK